MNRVGKGRKPWKKRCAYKDASTVHVNLESESIGAKCYVTRYSVLDRHPFKTARPKIR